MTPGELRVLVARNIRLVARRRGISLNRLADFATISRPSFHRALACDAAFTTDRLAKIALALNVAPHALFIDDPNALVLLVGGLGRAEEVLRAQNPVPDPDDEDLA